MAAKRTDLQPMAAAPLVRLQPMAAPPDHDLPLMAAVEPTIAYRAARRRLFRVGVDHAGSTAPK
jgi:hypothetical protein